MKQSASDAIVLKSIPFNDFDRVVHLFTEDRGLASAYLKGASKPGHALHSLISPFASVAIHYTQGKGEMLRVIEGAATESHVKIRERLSSLKSALKCTDSILKTQTPHRKNAQLYQLLRTYLGKIDQAPVPEMCATSFLLKLMHLEGIFDFASSCDSCHKEINKEDIFISFKETFCKVCSASYHLPVSYDEKIQLSFLSRVRSWEKLFEFPLIPELCEKVDRIFKELALEKEIARGGT